MPNPTPRTIEELKAWYVAHNLPPENVTRFFIGKNIQEPRAFGIYQEGEQFIVYKNKDNGSRAVRYQGYDEGYAVNELYMKLKSEIANQKNRNRVLTAEEHAAAQKKSRRIVTIAIIVLVLYLVVSVWISIKSPNRGYYHYNDDWYYYDNHSWYYYADDDWYPSSSLWQQAEKDNWKDYYEGSSYQYGNGYSDFSLTDYYSETDTDSSWDSSDSWDSGSTDWSSDW